MNILIRNTSVQLRRELRKFLKDHPSNFFFIDKIDKEDLYIINEMK